MNKQREIGMRDPALAKWVVVLLWVLPLGAMGPGCDSGGKDNAENDAGSDAGEDAGEDAGDDAGDNPFCYTPCKTGAVIDGEYVPCSDEGLIPGCYGGTVCQDGWCVTADDHAMKFAGGNAASTSGDGACVDDCGCADHGTCIDGQCTVQCEKNVECLGRMFVNPGTTFGCHRKVCRQACTSEVEAAKQCPVDTTCVIGSDGVNGYCMPSCAPPVDQNIFNCIKSTAADKVPFELRGESLIGGSFAFGENTTDAEFTLINNTRCTLDFVVRRKVHSEYTDEGIETVEDNPLHWLSLESGGSTSEGGSELAISQLAPSGEALIKISEVVNTALPNWLGTLEVGVTATNISEELGQKEIHLSYSSGVNGQWSGSMYYFGNFGTKQLKEWQDSDFSETALQEVGNAFVKRWGVLRRGAITLDNFMAAVRATQNEAWKWQTVKDRCPLSGGACYPFVNPQESPDDGIEDYSDDLATSPIPSGMVELPIAINIQAASGSDTFEGKVVSNQTLHYAGSPNITLTMAMPADSCEQVGELCRNMVTGVEADIVVGGRYPKEANEGTCNSTNGFPMSFTEQKIPWLLSDFRGETSVEQGIRYSYECRDTLHPFQDGSPLVPEGAVAAGLNQGFAGSNPLPSSQSLSRELSVVDGAIFNKELMFIIFEERFVVPMGASVPAEDFSGYGFMMLRRSPSRLDPATDYTGSAQVETRTFPDDVLRTECSPAVLSAMGESTVTSANVNQVAAKLINGSVEIDPATQIDSTDIYYLCWETGQIGGGPSTNASSGGGVVDGGVIDDVLAEGTCRESSNVTFFYFKEDVAVPIEFIKECNNDAVFGTTQSVKEWNDYSKQWETKDIHIVSQRGTCDQRLQEWQAQDGALVDPVQECEDASQSTCDGEPENRRLGKRFYSGGSNAGIDFGGLRTDVNDAFRYKTAFRSRSGKNLGFTPEICSDTQGAIPYCYHPGKIEEIEQRSDCALSLLSHSDLSQASRELLLAFLTESFKSTCTYQGDNAYTEELCRQPQFQQDGFEALNAELLIMLGDGAYTNSFASRFDLAATSTATFEGSLFEEGGIDLSGAAGNEMYNLYQATQYYQLALDRFYSLMSSIYQSIHDTENPSFITAETVTNYFDRLIRASTQKARAWSEIAKRYQSFNQPDLARRVIERAYTAAYLESVLITRLMHRVIDIVQTTEEAQIVYIIEQAQLRYKASLLELRDINQSITSDVNYFGFPPEYIPFPAVDEGDVSEGNINAFDKLRDSTMALIEFAGAKEELAITSKKDYEVDEAAFQAELASVRNNYENELSELCGTFKGDDGYIYPAIKENAEKNEQSKIMTDPCGLMGTGAIHQALGQVELAALEVQKANTRRSNKVAEIRNEMERVNAYCQTKIDFSHWVWEKNSVIIALDTIVNAGDVVLDLSGRATEMCYQFANLEVEFVASAAMIGWAGGIDMALAALIGAVQVGLKTGIGVIENEKETASIMHECDIEQINSWAAMSNLALEVLEIDLDILEAGKNMMLTLSEVTQLANAAESTYLEYQDSTQTAINFAAAMNDPNTRIYKNDAIINSDRAFWTAVKEAYKTTKVYEYYTSTSYAHLIDLFLVRMVSVGDYNLENYMMELDAAFYEFEEQYGNPDLRLAIISLRDDIFDIPTISTDEPGVALSAGERATLFTEKLTASQWLDGNGYIRIPFGTRLDEVSPVTRNHKIFYIEAEIQGADVGDAVGRVYLTQNGTGVIRNVEGEKQYYSFPERIAVVNTFFNGEKEIDADTILHSVYESNRFVDRPYANSEWELVFNGVDEAVNQDINLSSITDIRLYVYYTDFTAMP